MRKTKSLTADFIGWKGVIKLAELKLPNKDKCNLKCCEGIGRKVRIQLGKDSISKREGIVTHLNTSRAIIELNKKEGEVSINKFQLGALEMYKNDVEERKMKTDNSGNMDRFRPSMLTDTQETINDDFDEVEF